MTNLLSIPFKKAVDVPIRRAIRDYILAHRPDVHPDAFKWDISCWESLRKRACIDQSVHADRLESIYQYHGQLVFVLSKLPVNVGLSIPFSPIFPPNAEPIALPNLQYERYGVLFNLAALQSQLAAAEDRSITSGLNYAIHYYQEAAGTLNYLHSVVVPKLSATLPLSEFPPDITKSFLISLELLMLAQGQECAWQRAISAGYKNGLIAKLASKISSFYCDSLTQLRETPQSMKPFIPTGWVQHLEVKQLHFAAVAQYRKSLDDAESSRYGHEIARLSQAHKSAKKGYDIARRGNVSPTVRQDIESLLDNVQDTLKKTEHHNDLIYHDVIPTISELPAIQERPVVASVTSTKLLEPQNAISSDHPLFKELIGWGARTAIDIYKERRENWIKDEVSDPAQRLNDHIVNVLRSVNLPSALDALERPVGLPPSLLKKAEEVRHENGPAKIESSIENVQKLSQQDKTLLEEALDSLDQEAEEDEVFRADTRAMRTASQEANAELVQKATKWSAILQQAADSDELVRQKWVQWEPNIVELTWSEAELEASIPSSTVPASSRHIGSNPAQTHARALRVLLEQLDDLQRVRRDQVSRAQRLAAADDITPQIMKAAAAFEQWVEVQPVMLEEVLEEELVKFEKFRSEIEKGEQRQEQLLNSIKERNTLFLSSRKEEPMVKDRERALQSLDLAYHKYKEITRNLDEGLKFYNDFAGMLSQFKETCTAWVQERRNEMISLTRALEASTREESLPSAPLATAQHKQSPTTERNGGIVALDLPPPDSDEWEALALPPAPLMSGKRAGGKKSR